MPVKTVAMFVYDGVQALDVAGPIDVFAEANRNVADEDRYEIVLVAEGREPVRTSNGTRIILVRLSRWHGSMTLSATRRPSTRCTAE